MVAVSLKKKNLVIALRRDEAAVRERLDDGIADLQLTRKMYPFKYPFPPSEVVESFRAYYADQPSLRSARFRQAGRPATRPGAAVVGAQPVE